LSVSWHTEVFSLTLKLCASREFITSCSLFQVWFGDNRASIEFHERGKKHKDALAAKLRDLGRAAHEKEQAVGALKCAATHVIYTNGVGLAMENEYATGLSSKIFDPRQMKDVSSMAREMAKRKNELLEMKNKKRVCPNLFNSYETVAWLLLEKVKVEEPAPQEVPHPVQLTEVQQELQQQQQQQQQAAPVGPLGSWTKVKKSDRRKELFNFSAPVYSPLTARYRAEEERERKAPAIQFTEKTSGLLTKKVKGPIEFKKRTATKNVRQRTQ
uniref:U1-type domain-containing protein n=1 Tax=Heligmosomoides polygyrus TaxID=6339 RepID=A0A8L8KNG3_HELPZ